MNARLQRFRFEVSYKNGTKQPFDAPGIALALKYLYEVYEPNEVVAANLLSTQIEYPDFPIPKNPRRSAIKSEPALNIRASEAADPNILNASLGKRPLPIQAQQDKDREIAQLKEKLKRSEESKVELKYLIRNGLKFLVKEQDWKSSQEALTIPANKVKGVLKEADINWTSSEESKSDGEGPQSPKRQRTE
ncbi:MAG: DHH family phosphoesterase, partial [Bacteroidota bacterium]